MRRRNFRHAQARPVVVEGSLWAPVLVASVALGVLLALLLVSTVS